MEDVHSFMKKDFSSGEFGEFGEFGGSSEFINFIKYKIEPFFEYALYFMGMLAIILGAINAIVVGWRTRREKTQDESLAYMRIRLSETIALGLTFILAAEVIKTFRVPNIYQLFKVALLVLLRQMITYFLDKEVSRLKQEYPGLIGGTKPATEHYAPPESEYDTHSSEMSAPLTSEEQYIPFQEVPDVTQETCVACQ